MPAKRKTAPSGASASVLMALSFAEAVALPQSDRIERFLIESLSGQRAFSSMGKLFRVIEGNLEADQTIFRLLQGAGIKKGTVSNASYAAKVWDLVVAEQLTEDEYNSLAFNDCWQICRVQSKTSKRQLTPTEVAAVVRNSADFADDLSSLYETGLTAEERAAAAAKAKAAKAEAEAKAAAKLVAEKAELEELRKRKAELDAGTGGNEPEAKPDAKTEAKPDAKTDAKTDAKKPDAKKPEVNTPPPATAAKITAEDLLRLLDEVEAGLARLSALDQDRVAARIVELAELATIKA